MAYLNQVQLIGNLGKDPEARSFPNGDMVTSFPLATTKRWKDKKTGAAAEHTEWHRVVIAGPAAKTAAAHLKKGAAIYAPGELRTHKWQDKDGADRYTTEITCRTFQFLDRKPGDADLPEGEGE